MAITYKVCPKCNSKDVANIIYGYPTEAAMKEAEQGKIRLGGCVVTMNDPEYACNTCDYEWDREEVITLAYEKIRKITVFVGGYGGPSYSVELDLQDRKVVWKETLDIYADVPQIEGPRTDEPQSNETQNEPQSDGSQDDEAQKETRTIDSEFYYERQLNEKDITSIRSTLMFADLLNWKKNYEDPGVLDGTHWSIDIEREGRNISKNGNNAYPDEWEMFCDLIQRVTEKQFG